MKSYSKLLGLAAPALILMGCSSTGEVVDAPVEEVPAPAVIEQPVTPSITTIPVDPPTFSGTTEVYSGDALDDPDSVLAIRVIYFEYDSSNIRDEFQSVISAHATYLIDNPNAFLVLEGHADERGTREYNMALGERRANSVKNAMLMQGVSAGQLEVVSYGEERPAVMGSDSDSWAQNRRVELRYQGR